MELHEAYYEIFLNSFMALKEKDSFSAIFDDEKDQVVCTKNSGDELTFDIEIYDFADQKKSRINIAKKSSYTIFFEEGDSRRMTSKESIATINRTLSKIKDQLVVDNELTTKTISKIRAVLPLN